MSIERTSLWYAFVTQSRHEKKVKTYLDAAKIESYLPLISSVRQWKDRKKTVETPLFSCYIFVKIEYVFRYDILKIPSVARVVSFNKKPTPVREEEIEEIKLILGSNFSLDIKDGFVEGDAVEIKSGPLKGLVGRVNQQQGNNILSVYIDAIAKTILIDIGSNKVERI
jgi:transcription antitermination factor NusG